MKPNVGRGLEEYTPMLLYSKKAINSRKNVIRRPKFILKILTVANKYKHAN